MNIRKCLDIFKVFRNIFIIKLVIKVFLEKMFTIIGDYVCLFVSLVVFSFMKENFFIIDV